MSAYRYLIIGVVQGVGYRHFVLRVANQLGIKGTVRNLPTGEVEVFACLSEERLKIFENLLREGPFYSRVEEVQRENAEWAGPFEGFSVLF